MLARNTAEVIDKFCLCPTKEEILTRPAFRILPGGKGSAGHYIPYEILDLRWKKHVWQRKAWSATGDLRDVPGVCVQKIPRRHGKTHNNIYDGISYLYRVPLSRPIGAFYAPAKDQTIRNTWIIFEAAVSRIPGAIMNKNKGFIILPRPTLVDPLDYITIYFFGIKGGSGTKRGGYYDYVNFDEVEYIDITFIKEVGFISGLGRKPKVVLTGTPDGFGNLDYWIEEAQRRERLVAAIDAGENIPKEKIPSDVRDWRAVTGDCAGLGLFTKEDLDELRAKIGDEIFEKEMNCNDKGHQEAFYYRADMDRAREDFRITPTVRPEKGVPVRYYYDLGVGNKTDLAAVGAFQLLPTKVLCLWSVVLGNADYLDIAEEVVGNPLHQSGLLDIEHVLPHDAKNRDQKDRIPKYVAFEETLRKVGLRGEVRCMLRPPDVRADTTAVRDVIRKSYFNEISCDKLVEALEKHRKQKDLTSGLYLDRPSKTKFRDLADMFRGMSVDYLAEDYKMNMGGQILRSSRFGDKRTDTGGHPHDIHSLWNQHIENPGGVPDFLRPMV